MISNYFHRIIFIILLCSTFADKIKILQLSESMTSLCVGKKCNDNQNSNIIDFINTSNPNVVLWFMEFTKNNTIFHKLKNIVKPHVIILPVYGSNIPKNTCLDTNKFGSGCYYVYTVRPTNISFIVLNTGLWLNDYYAILAKNQIEWLKHTLMNFKSIQKKVIIVGYDSPGILETSYSITKYKKNFNNILVELLQSFSTTISQCIFGGGNMDAFRIIINNGKPVFPIFLLLTNESKKSSLIPNVRIYNFNTVNFMIDNYIQYHRNVSAKYGYSVSYDMENVHVKQLFDFTESFYNVTLNFQRYYNLQLKNVSFGNCNNDNFTCVKCCSRCFIFNLILLNLTDCLNQCSLIKMAVGFSDVSKTQTKKSNGLYVLCVIIGFVVILLGIVLAVNKTYCIRRNRQDNVFLTPLTLDIHTDLNDDVSINSKLPTSKAVIVPNHTRTLNSHKCSDIEQTYDYIRM